MQHSFLYKWSPDRVIGNHSAIEDRTANILNLWTRLWSQYPMSLLFNSEESPVRDEMPCRFPTNYFLTKYFTLLILNSIFCKCSTHVIVNWCSKGNTKIIVEDYLRNFHKEVASDHFLQLHLCTSVWIHGEIKQGSISQCTQQVVNAFKGCFQYGTRNYFWKIELIMG